MSRVTKGVEVLPQEQWRPYEAAHAARVDAATAAHRARRGGGRAHPVEDFLFTYYNHKPAHLRRWHAGVGVALAAAAGDERATWRFTRTTGDALTLEVDAFLAARGATVRFVHELLTRTLERPAHLGCFGLHEWAMAYRLRPDEQRHADWPLRLGPEGTDAVVESHQVTCSHVDAYRFFTPAAVPLNTLRPTRPTQSTMEQPGCLHAGMDVYKWAYKLTPAVPSDLVMDCFELAREIRELDMRAAPYDLSELGVAPVRIETRAGKAEYVAAQRGFAQRSDGLRRRLVAVCDTLLGARHGELEDGQHPPDDGPARALADTGRAEA
ncbi:MAG: 3-methyladenine DNA glycosylase [Actinomycetota bacterium]|nr:3-methyladenine DNA glycosylase [Actinomycetota bacterium]